MSAGIFLGGSFSDISEAREVVFFTQIVEGREAKANQTRQRTLWILGDCSETKVPPTTTPGLRMKDPLYNNNIEQGGSTSIFRHVHPYG
jgi:hypothetical protein